jgi:hypothetical protein
MDLHVVVSDIVHTLTTTLSCDVEWAEERTRNAVQAAQASTDVELLEVFRRAYSLRGGVPGAALIAFTVYCSRISRSKLEAWGRMLLHLDPKQASTLLGAYYDTEVRP